MSDKLTGTIRSEHCRPAATCLRSQNLAVLKWQLRWKPKRRSQTVAQHLLSVQLKTPTCFHAALCLSSFSPNPRYFNRSTFRRCFRRSYLPDWQHDPLTDFSLNTIVWKLDSAFDLFWPLCFVFRSVNTVQTHLPLPQRKGGKRLNATRIPLCRCSKHAH